jgi:hypothetical protein
MDQLDIGCSPYEEDCVQVGTENYLERAKEECTRYISLLRELFGDEKEHNCSYKITHNPHDFGTYLDVAIRYDENDEESIAFAFFIEENSPARWSTKKEEYCLTFEQMWEGRNEP